jgi:hypothetical protein
VGCLDAGGTLHLLTRRLRRALHVFLATALMAILRQCWTGCGESQTQHHSSTRQLQTLIHDDFLGSFSAGLSVRWRPSDAVLHVFQNVASAPPSQRLRPTTCRRLMTRNYALKQLPKAVIMPPLNPIQYAP